MTTTALQQKSKTAGALRTLVEQPQYAARFKEVLKDRAPQFVASLIQLVNGSLQLQNCDPNSVLAAAITAAALDLPIEKNLGFAWIVPYGGMAQFQLGYKGYVQLAIRSRQYKFINVTEVYEGELDFHNRMTSEIVLRPENRKSNTVVGYAAYFKLVNGYEHAEYWDVQTVKDHALRYSQAYKQDRDTPWKTDFDKMAMKTVLKALLSHWGILSVEMRSGMDLDMTVRATVESDPVWIDSAPQTEVKTPEFRGPVAELPPSPPEEKKRGRKPKEPQPHQASSAAPAPAESTAPAVQSQPGATASPDVFNEPQTDGNQEIAELMALRLAMKSLEISDRQVEQWAMKNKLLDPANGKTTLVQMQPTHMNRLTDAINRGVKGIIDAIKSFPVESNDVPV